MLLIQLLKKIGEVLEDFCDKNCCDRISETSKPRELTKSAYEKAYKVPVADLKCMVTGVSHTALIAAAPTSSIPPNSVTLSHLLARNAYAKERDSLGYKKADIDNIRNTILLCKGIEEAFNQKNLSFVPNNKPFSFVPTSSTSGLKPLRLIPSILGHLTASITAKKFVRLGLKMTAVLRLL